MEVTRDAAVQHDFKLLDVLQLLARHLPDSVAPRVQAGEALEQTFMGIANGFVVDALEVALNGDYALRFAVQELGVVVVRKEITAAIFAEHNAGVEVSAIPLLAFHDD